MANKSLKLSFEQVAGKIAEMYTLDAKEVKQAYQDRHDSLESHFNAASEARDQRVRNIAWTVATGVVGLGIWPVLGFTAWNAYRIYDRTQTINNVGEAVRAEIENFKAKPVAAPAPAGTI